MQPLETEFTGRCQMPQRKSETPQQRQSRASQIAQAYRTAHEVVSGAISMAVMTGGGYWLDRKFGFSPVLTICGATLGFVVAGVSLRTLLQRLDQESARKRKSQKSIHQENQSK
jgi:F0F1-type ATP synthase assembly protein I